MHTKRKPNFLFFDEYGLIVTVIVFIKAQ